MNNITDDCNACIQTLLADTALLHWHYFMVFILIIFACVNDLFYAMFEDLRYITLLRLLVVS